MQEIRQAVQTFLEGPQLPQPRAATLSQVRRNQGIRVANYRELVSKVAELAFANPEFVLLFRGQTRDYEEQARSTLFPTMFRLNEQQDQIDTYPLRQRYQTLQEKEQRLIETFPHEYRQRLGRNQILRWAILQHYEICPTPLLDVTHSLLVAASFAFAEPDDGRTESYLYVLGLPQISGSVTVVSDQSLQIVRLSSVCPPTTLRPYFQEGYLICTFPMLDTIHDKMQYERSEVDCGNRLIAKFRLKRDGFWGDGFSLLTNEALYPNEHHPLTGRILALRDQRGGPE